MEAGLLVFQSMRLWEAQQGNSEAIPMRKQLLTLTLGLLVAISSASAVSVTTNPNDAALGTLTQVTTAAEIPAAISSDAVWASPTNWPLGGTSTSGFDGPLYVSGGGALLISPDPAKEVLGLWIQPLSFANVLGWNVQYQVNDSTQFGDEPFVGTDPMFLGFYGGPTSSISLSLQPVDPSGTINNGFVVGDFRIAGTEQEDPDVIPEPMTMALSGLGVAGLAGYVRRRRRDA